MKKPILLGDRKAYAKIEVATGKVLKERVLWPAFPDDTPIAGDDGTIKFVPMFEDVADEQIDRDNFLQKTIVPTGEPALAAGEFYIRRPVEKRSEVRRKAGGHRSRTGGYRPMPRTRRGAERKRQRRETTA